MARTKPSPVERTLTQVDRAFWCIHEHLDVMVPLGLPTMVGIIVVAVALVNVHQTWELPGWAGFLVYSVAVPFFGLLIFTTLSLPCAVFAWRRAGGEVATARECFAACADKGGQLAWLVFRLALMWLPSLVLLGVPLMIVWPRTCLTPLVLLFEDHPKIFRRSRRILREDLAVYVIGGIYLSIGLVLGLLIFVPRLVLSTNALGAKLMDAEWRRFAIEYLWIFEALSVAIVLTALAMSWWIALTLLYHDIRMGREGEDLRNKLLRLREKIAIPGGNPL